MVEYTLPDFAEQTWTVHTGDALFAEYCFAAGATCARNHCRVLGKPEADCLGNREFVLWYDRNVLSSLALRGLFELKERVRTEGYASALLAAPEHARAYLSQLYEEAAKGIRPPTTR